MERIEDWRLLIAQRVRPSVFKFMESLWITVAIATVIISVWLQETRGSWKPHEISRADAECYQCHSRLAACQHSTATPKERGWFDSERNSLSNRESALYRQ